MECDPACLQKIFKPVHIVGCGRATKFRNGPELMRDSRPRGGERENGWDAGNLDDDAVDDAMNFGDLRWFGGWGRGGGRLWTLASENLVRVMKEFTIKSALVRTDKSPFFC